MNSACPCAGVPSDYSKQANEYQPFLKNIARSLGLGENEAVALAEETCIIAARRYVDQNEGLPLTLWMSKHLIRSCVFVISSAMFEQAANAIDIYAGGSSFIPFSVRKLPLSLRTVYILVHLIGFREAEVAKLLNITPLQVKERLGKAAMKM